MSLKLFVERDDWKYPGDDYANNKNNNFWGNCSPAERSNISKYEIPEYYKFQVDWIELKYGPVNTGVEPGAYIPTVPAHFSTKSSCEQNGRRHLIQIKGWNINSYTTYKHKYKSKYICIKTSNL